jgi:hypothetical protein
MTASLLKTCAGIFNSFLGSTGGVTNGIPNMDTDMADVEEKKPGLFAQCHFAIIRTAAFSEKDALSVCARTLPQSIRLTTADGGRVEAARWCGGFRQIPG